MNALRRSSDVSSHADSLFTARTAPAPAFHRQAAEMNSVGLFLEPNQYHPTFKPKTPAHEYPYDQSPYHDPQETPAPAQALMPQSSLSSILSAPLAARLSFQTFTNFIPMPWASKDAPVSSDLTSSDRCDAGAITNQRQTMRMGMPPRKEAPSVPLKRGYVPRERQLAKLRLRMQREGTSGTGTSFDVCKKCDDEVIFL